MRVLAVLCLLAFAVTVYSQTCDTQTVTYSTLLDAGSFSVDATKLATVKGVLTVTKGTPGSITVDYQKGQRYGAAVTKGLVTITRAPLDAATTLGAANMLVTLALAALALVSQRGSLAALALVLAIATVVLAACSTDVTVDINVVVDSSLLKSFTIKVKADATTSQCPTTYSVAGALAPWVTNATSAGVCTFTFTNPLYPCDNTCGTLTQNVDVDATSCNAGTCVYECTTGFQFCGGNCLTASDALNACGSCNNDCEASVQNAQAGCSAGACVIVNDECDPGFSNCDNNAANGCEAAANDVNTCGACPGDPGADCEALPNIDTNQPITCTNGACVYECAPGFGDCTSGLGCETAVNTNARCGSCANDCTVAAPNTQSGTCNTTDFTCDFACDPGFDNCDDVTAGCETSTDSDINNCGGCGITCSGPNVDPLTTSCVGGVCVIGCVAGTQDCDGELSTGCEAITASDPENCNACNNSCTSLPNVESATCSSGSCNVVCAQGFDNCAATPNAGCPDDLSGDLANCGLCGANCNSVENAVAVCTGGDCDFTTCNPGFQHCDTDRGNGCETSLTSKNACGACDLNCEEISGLAGHYQDAICTVTGGQGSCSFVCATGFTNCDGVHTNGCEVNTFADVTQCGGCGASFACNLPNTATYNCVGGVCSSNQCNTDFSFCSNPATGGCTIDLKEDPDNCGACGTDCSTRPNVQASVQCDLGVCMVATACANTHNDCDGDALNGCETPVSQCTPVTPGSRCAVARGYATGPNVNINCESLNGTMNVVSAFCNLNPANPEPLGTCKVTCAAGWSDCNNDLTDGCESNAAACGSALTPGQCETALKDPNNPVAGQTGQASCLALKNDPVINQTVVQGANLNECVSDVATQGGVLGQCLYTCQSTHFDCDGSAVNGCEINKAICPTESAADCIFNNDTRCGRGLCLNCLTLSGTQPGTASCNPTTEQCQFTCPTQFCRDADNDWSTGCEQAQTYASLPGLTAIDCSKDIDLTNVVANGPILCDGDSTSETAGRCKFTCKDGFRDCDENPRNGCETSVTGPCFGCTFQADVSCGKNKCVDCTTLEGTLESDYANGRWASASASTCLAVNASVNDRVTDFYCDTSVHYLNPRFDPPDGDNGACQSELCRDLDGDWSNGCESAQQYGRGRFYYYGDSTNTDSYLVPYVPNPYEDRFYVYKRAFTAFPNSAPATLLNDIAHDIKILSAVYNNPSLFGVPASVPSAIAGSLALRGLFWKNPFTGGFLVGGVVGGAYQHPLSVSGSSSTFTYSPLVVSGIQIQPSIQLTGRELALLHYAADRFTEVDEPAEAAYWSILGEVYNNPVDCVLSEWSDWGKCTYEDDCIRVDYFLMTRIRTRAVIQPAANGGVCHLPLVEDFYRFSHRNSNKNIYSVLDGTWTGTINGLYGIPKLVANFGADHQHGGGFGVVIDYTDKDFQDNVFDINKILLWGPENWSREGLWSDSFGPVNDPRQLSWTGNELGTAGAIAGSPSTNPNATADRSPTIDAYGILLTCAPYGTCPDVTVGLPKIACNITTWSEWSACSASCDGDWAGGVRIRTRTVISGAKWNGFCFETEFDQNGLPLPLYGHLAGQLYEEDWQCNDHSCASFDCRQLKNPQVAAANHIYLGADAVSPQCDGRDWPEYVNGIAWVDVNRDGYDDNTIYVRRGEEVYPFEGNFPLWNTIYNYSYEFRWPGHCLYECEEGWFDCDHRPENGCETNGDYCSIDAEYLSTTQLTHPIVPWKHPHGDCTLAWKHDKSGVVARDCTNYNQLYPELQHTTGVCINTTGLCDLSCEPGYFNCAGDGCVSVRGDEGYCGTKCVDCDQLDLFKYGYPAGWECVGSDLDDYTCKPTGSCHDGCTNEDKNLLNGCETAIYQQWPYPEVESTPAVIEDWSAWTICTRADDCGYLWDMSGGNVFRNVPIQARFRRPLSSAYNGGWYPEFSYNPVSALRIAGQRFPSENNLRYNLTLFPELRDIRGLPLVQTPFYEVRVCPTPVSACINCTNQLEGIEVHCELSAWTKWSACSAECIDRFVDLEYNGVDELTASEFLAWDPDNDYYVTDRDPYQIRTRTVIKSATLGGRCPPPLDTWQQAEAAANVNVKSFGVSSSDLIDAPYSGVSNLLLSAKASFLVDVRKCNAELCTYPEDCDALNYWYPGHFASIVTCGPSQITWESSSASSSTAIAQCVANTGFGSVSDGDRFYEGSDYNGFCNPLNGYCDTVNTDLRDGCDTYVYPTHCGRVVDGQCDYAHFYDCTELPGVITPFAAPCVIDPVNNDYDGDESSFARPNPSENLAHACDIRWACNATACQSEDYPNRPVDATIEGSHGPRTFFSPSTSYIPWQDGCEVARNYRYPFVTVESRRAYDPEDDPASPLYDSSNPDPLFGNPIGWFYNTYAQPYDGDLDANLYYEGSIVWRTFWDPTNNYNLSETATALNSGPFSFDCHGFLYSEDFCGRGGNVKQPPFYEHIVEPYAVFSNPDYADYPYFDKNEGCHLAGLPEVDAFNTLGFGCNGVWRTPTFGMCVMNCADGYADADLDPRNGCETDLFEKATPEDRYVWVGDCAENAEGSAWISNVTTCGADLCINCNLLPGTLATGVVGEDKPDCFLVEESSQKIPVLAYAEDYYAIQYACGVASGDFSPVYVGYIDFNDAFCNPATCYDGDDDWTNGCEQGRAYAGANYLLGGVYDEIFDSFNYVDPDADAPADPTVETNAACFNEPGNNFYNRNGNACDPRSSGFEFPIPGAWFFTAYSTLQADTFDLARMSYNVEDIDEFLLRVGPVDGTTTSSPVSDTLNARLLASSVTPITYTQALNNRAFDCSLLYSTYLSYVHISNVETPNKFYVAGDYYYVGEGNGIYTFGHVHHINTSAYPTGGENNVCNRATGFCNYVCEDGWDDYDADPSNGCEADLSGPCGRPAAVRDSTYFTPASCGGSCTNCTILPGTYQVPSFRSECLKVLPHLFAEEEKADWVLRHSRFGHACSTEILRSNLAQNQRTVFAWQHIICNPLVCFDLDYDYENGCELAVDYPYEWAAGATKKVAWNHWFSPIPDNTGAHTLPETQYWVRDDGTVTISNDNGPNGGVSGPPYWVRLFDLFDEFEFIQWDIRSLPGSADLYNSLEWYNWSVGEDNADDNPDPEDLPIEAFDASDDKGNVIFPYTGITSAWDCSNSELLAGVETITLNASPLFTDDVFWSLTTEMAGPWFHVRQDRVSSCNAGPNPGAFYNDYSNGNNNIVPTNYCTPESPSWNGQAYDFGCYSTWDYPGSGRCLLACEDNWGDGDGDPSNGCESYELNGKPYPGSVCGPKSSGDPRYNDPVVDDQYPDGNYNYNLDSNCGAGVCLSCLALGGVYHSALYEDATRQPEGMKSGCIDGGDDWATLDGDNVAGYPVLGGNSTVKATSSGFPVEASVPRAVDYPGDFYCTGIINENSCLRYQIAIPCAGSGLPDCGGDGNFYASVTGGRQSVKTSPEAAFLQVCADRDDVWETGCEVALGYNLALDTVGPSTDTDVDDSLGAPLVIQGIYKRSIGVKPYYDNNFAVIDWTNTAAPNPVLAGFDCDILRLLPREHTHITPQSGSYPHASTIECSARAVPPGTCSFQCDNGWVDCDNNPWNGCEQSTILCGGQPLKTLCNTARRYNPLPNLDCQAQVEQTRLARSSFCDGNQLPYDDWHIYYVDNYIGAGSGAEDGINTNDESQYDDYFEITDHGIDHVDVVSNYVDPYVSRYTILGYWDNLEVDYSCRVWINGTQLRNNVPADANYATGRCVIDCDESNGFSHCDADHHDGGCDAHNTPSFCRTTAGLCTACGDLPGIINSSQSRCLSTYQTSGGLSVNINSFSSSWPQGDLGIQAGGSGPYIVTYGFPNFANISNEHPQCDTRGVRGQTFGTGIPIACDDTLCRDYDGDWENGCEFPMRYNASERARWETPGALYRGSSDPAQIGVVIDGFDCSWISDPQPDAGGRNYGGKTWAQKYHVDTSAATGHPGHCIGRTGQADSGKCRIRCMPGWEDCDKDPTNGCETDTSLCFNCDTALGYPDGVNVTCSALTNETLGFVPFSWPNLPKCNGREGANGQCIYYFCNIFEGFCDSGLGAVLTTTGCISQTANNEYCGADWNWRDIRGNVSTVEYEDEEDEGYDPDYEGGFMLDYSVFDGTGRCASCDDLNGYSSPSAVCRDDQVVAGNTRDNVVFYKPAAAGWISNTLGFIKFDTAGNTVGDYLCQLHGELDAGDDGACDRNLCVDEDYYWANGCETAVNYPVDLLSWGESGSQRHQAEGDLEFGFDYHFAYNDENYGIYWPYNAEINGVQTSDVLRSEIRGIWCPFLQFWSLATDNYFTGDCDVFPCPHFHPDTAKTWITCVNNATDALAGQCNFVCNVAAGWKDCDANPLTGCETDIFSDGTCGDQCEQVECNTIDGLNPFYWSECIGTVEGTSSCDLSICEPDLCANSDNDWTNGCETAQKYSTPQNCRFANTPEERKRLHFAWVKPCNGEPGNHWAGKCEFECEPGWVDCDDDFITGCEHDGSLCQDCTKALGYVTKFDGADWWEFWGPASNTSARFYQVVYGSYFDQNTRDYSYEFVPKAFKDSDTTLFDQFEGPNVAYSQYHHAFVAAYDCSQLRTIYPGHFTAAEIKCDSDKTSITAGRCIYACNATAGYFDCDGDPRNGCEHQSQHQSCGAGGECRDCYYISGVDYPVDTDGNDLNDGSQGPYTDGAFNLATDPVFGRTLGDVYAERNVTYHGLRTDVLLKLFPDPNYSPLRLGCTKVPNSEVYSCNLDTCVTTVQGFQPCKNDNQFSSAGWRDGCEVAYNYGFNNTAAGKVFDCSLLGPDAGNGDMPRNTTDHTLPSFHVRQVVGTFGCDSQAVDVGGSIDDVYVGKGAWRYILARFGRTPEFGVGDNETSGRWAFDYQGLENYFRVNDDLDVDGDVVSAEDYTDLAFTVDDFVVYRVRGSDRIGTCYYECEYGYEDCNGDPRDGCEILTSACIDIDGEIGWDYVNFEATNGCEVALGYTGAQLGQTGAGPFLFPCTEISNGAIGLHVNDSYPIYCRGGQDGNTNNLGTCQFTCMDGWQDCNGNPTDGCEAEIGNEACDCVNCLALPGTISITTDPDSQDFEISNSTCQAGQCSLDCDTSYCSNADSNWKNGCETAHRIPTPRNRTAIPSYDCSTWAKEPLTAKKHHIDPKKLSAIFCEGRPQAPGAGTCTYALACLKRNAGGVHNYQDCNGDPRDGCEDIARWCVGGDSATGPAPRGTQSDLCSAALRYQCSNAGFNSNDEPCEDLVTPGDPFFDCEELFRTAVQLEISKVDNVTGVIPYCDRDPTHLETRGDCVFDCLEGYANCDNDARNGCEANITFDHTCNTDCIDCNTLPGVDVLLEHKCVVDSAVDGTYKCSFTCTGNSGSSSCADADGKWQNGCELALNSDIDIDGIFVNQGDPMDCSVMQAEGKKNPELFRHHLHIDLSVPVPTPSPLLPMPAGSIFCNGLISGTGIDFGKCYFMCIPGFYNSDRSSYNGCEAAYPTTQARNPLSNPFAITIPRPFTAPGPAPYPYVHGGYLIGDYEVEQYLFFLNVLYAGTIQTPTPVRSPIKLPRNVFLMQHQWSLLEVQFGTGFPQPVMWY